MDIIKLREMEQSQKTSKENNMKEGIDNLFIDFREKSKLTGLSGTAIKQFPFSYKGKEYFLVFGWQGLFYNTEGSEINWDLIIFDKRKKLMKHLKWIIKKLRCIKPQEDLSIELQDFNYYKKSFVNKEFKKCMRIWKQHSIQNKGFHFDLSLKSSHEYYLVGGSKYVHKNGFPVVFMDTENKINFLKKINNKIAISNLFTQEV